MPLFADWDLRVRLRGVLLFVAGVVVMVSACSDDRSDFPGALDRIPSLSLQERADRFGEPITLGLAGVRFRRPTGWTLLDSTAARRVQRSVRVEHDAFRVRPLRAYGEQATSSFLVVSMLQTAETAPKNAMAVYRRALDARHSEVRLDTLRRDGTKRMLDFVITSRQFVHHKLVLNVRQGAWVQFDYVVPRIHYARMVSVVEATVGSIRALRQH